LRLTPGTVLCFFTDGLVERRDKPLDDRITRLCKTVSAGPPESVCVAVIGALVRSDQVRDDIALLVLLWRLGTGDQAV
jgi:phosphoserine phosphatase RsbU/P